MECKVCKTKKGVKGYIIADDLENPQPYCKKCYDDLWIKIMKSFSPQDYDYSTKPPVCFKCKKKMKPIIEKSGKKSEYSFSCKCSPDLILSIG